MGRDVGGELLTALLALRTLHRGREHLLVIRAAQRACGDKCFCGVPAYANGLSHPNLCVGTFQVARIRDSKKETLPSQAALLEPDLDTGSQMTPSVCPLGLLGHLVDPT